MLSYCCCRVVLSRSQWWSCCCVPIASSSSCPIRCGRVVVAVSSLLRSLLLPSLSLSQPPWSCGRCCSRNGVHLVALTLAVVVTVAVAHIVATGHAPLVRTSKCGYHVGIQVEARTICRVSRVMGNFLSMPSSTTSWPTDAYDGN